MSFALKIKPKLNPCKRFVLCRPMQAVHATL